MDLGDKGLVAPDDPFARELRDLEKFGIRRTRDGFYYIAHYYPLKAMHAVSKRDAANYLSLLEGKPVETYIHYPYCEIKCSFCHFHKDLKKPTYATKNENELIDAIIREIDLTVSYTGAINARSFYIGGGTPSLMSLDDMKKLLLHVDRNFRFESGAELKFELFPKLYDDIEIDEILDTLISFGITDIIIDLESGNQKSLNAIGRRISSKEAYLALVDKCISRGFKSIVTGLIIGLPYETESSLLNCLSMLADIDEVSVINTFPLISRFPDPIWRQIKSGYFKDIDARNRDNLWILARTYLRDREFVEGPISYMKRGGKVSAQQSEKFECVDLLAFGPSAFGYINGPDTAAQYFNVCNNREYINRLQNDELPMWRAGPMGNEERARRRLIFALANCRAVDLRDIQSEFSVDISSLVGRELNAFEALKLISVHDADRAIISYTELGRTRLEELSYFLGSDHVKDAVKRPLDAHDADFMETTRHNYYIDVPEGDRQLFEQFASKFGSVFCSFDGKL